MKKCFGSKKANIKWLKEGDKNTIFFHQAVKHRRQKLAINRIRDGNSIWLDKHDDIANEVVEAFKR